MRKILILLGVFVALSLFVYFYQIEGEGKREQAKKLEESVFKVEKENVLSFRIDFPDRAGVGIKRSGESWALDIPIDAPADGSTVDSFLSEVLEARAERRLEGIGPDDLSQFGLDQPRASISLEAETSSKTLQVGKNDFVGSKTYAKLADSEEVLLISNQLYSSADKKLSEWRDKRVLVFDRAKVVGVEIVRKDRTLKLEKAEDRWLVTSPLEDAADEAAITGILSNVDLARIEEFVDGEASDLDAFGLEEPVLRLSLTIAESGDTQILEIGSQTESSSYYARDPSRAGVFKIKSDLEEKLRQEVWHFRDKEVLNVGQDQVSKVKLTRGDEEITIRHEDFKWLLESPVEHEGKEVFSYKFWYPIDDIEFESIEDSDTSPFPEASVIAEFELNDGTAVSFRFARSGEQYVARRDLTGVKVESAGRPSKDSISKSRTSSTTRISRTVKNSSPAVPR